VNVLTNAARLWEQSSLERKQRLQRMFFPEGLVFDASGFRTAVTCLAFEALAAPDDPESYLASPTGCRRLMRVAVTAGAELSVSAPTEVHDFEKLRVAMWTVLPDGRFFVGLKNENEDDITRYNLVLNWTEELKRKMRAAR
jgi:hypothetical protein